MEFLLKAFGPKTWLALLPSILIMIGNYFKGRDANSTGPDDAAGNLFIALAPAIEGLDTSNENAFKKALRTVRDTITNYLGE